MRGSIFERISKFSDELWADLMGEPIEAPKMPGATRSVKQVVAEKVGSQELVIRAVNGHVSIEGNCRSLTINGRRVRFKEPT